LAGCGSSESYSVAPVSGQVKVDGKPLQNGYVIFSPVAQKGNPNPGPGSSGFTDQEGRYTLTIEGKGTNGAVVGKHKVMIDLKVQDDPADDRPKKILHLPARYHGRNTKLEFTVPSSGTDHADFLDLTSK
jgi:hypothetical protein